MENGGKDSGGGNYQYTYTRFFNIIFHIGVIFNVVLVIWLYLVYFKVI